MLTIIDVIRKISLEVQKKYPRYALQDRDIDDTINRPCAFVDLGSIKCDMSGVRYIRDTTEVKLYFFCEDLDKGFLELLDLKNDVMAFLSNGFSVCDENGQNGYYVVPTDLEAEIYKSDKALEVTFTVELIQGYEDETTEPYMEDLHY